MKYGINTLDDFNFYSKVVLCRLDLNSPYDKEKNILKDTSRIKLAIPTIEELSDKGAKLVLLSHQGGDLEYHNYTSTEVHAKEISKLIKKDLIFIDDVCGPAAREAISTLKNGEILMLDNVRYLAEETTMFETKLNLSVVEQTKTIVVKKLAPIADIYVCDAFSAIHRNQPTLVGFEELIPSAMGRLFEKEYESLSKIIQSPEKPCIMLIGGSKIEEAFIMIPAVLKKNIADEILCGGLLASVFMIASGIDIGALSKEIVFKKKLNLYIEEAKIILNEYPGKIILPLDYAYSIGKRIEIDSDALPINNLIADIGRKTINLYKNKLKKAKTIFVNGPVGIFEDSKTESGTKELWEFIAHTDKFSVIGGGDSIAAVNKYGLSKGFSYICTGGGAMVKFLSGEEQPIINALKKSAKVFKNVIKNL